MANKIEAQAQALAQSAQGMQKRLLLACTDRLPEFPRLYEADPRYGEGVRRIGTVGQNVLYEVDDQEQIVRVLAVVGQRQNPRRIKG